MLTIKPCLAGRYAHRVIHVDDEVLSQLDLPSGAVLHLNRQRAPGLADVVLAELVLRNRLERIVCRYAEHDGVVSLQAIARRRRSIVKPRYEVGVLGVVDGYIDVSRGDTVAGDWIGQLGCSRPSSRSGVSLAFWYLGLIAALLAMLLTSCGQGASPPSPATPAPRQAAPTRWSFDETARAVLPREATPLRGA